MDLKFQRICDKSSQYMRNSKPPEIQFFNLKSHTKPHVQIQSAWAQSPRVTKLSKEVRKVYDKRPFSFYRVLRPRPYYDYTGIILKWCLPKLIKCSPSTLRCKKNATITSHFRFVFEENLGMESQTGTSSLSKAPFSKCFPPTRKRVYLTKIWLSWMKSNVCSSYCTARPLHSLMAYSQHCWYKKQYLTRI